MDASDRPGPGSPGPAWGGPPRVTTVPPQRLGVLAWGWLVVPGVVAIGLGLVSILSPGVTVTVLAVAFSLWLLATGASRGIAALAMSGWPTWRRLVVGVLGAALAVLGVAGLVNVAGSERLLAAVIGIGFLVAAGVDLLMTATGRRGRGRVATGVLALLHVLLAVVFLLLPDVGLRAVAVLVGLVFVVLGIGLLVAAMVVRRAANRLLAMAAAGPPGGPGHPEDPTVIQGEVVDPPPSPRGIT